MNQNQSILLLENDHKERTALCEAFERWGYRVTTAHNGDDAFKKIHSDIFHLVIVSCESLEFNGSKFLEKVKGENRDLGVLFLANHTTIENAVEIMKAGALDFIIKPVDPLLMKSFLKRAFDEDEDGRNENYSISRKNQFERIITQDKAMLRLLGLAKQVSDSMASVFIQGESGTGKELFARFIHKNSNRQNGPFSAVNCGALPESLLESELFGYEKGAFTGAVSRKPGKFESAAGGTILLDEITEMQVHLQAKLLRVLQEKEIDMVGGRRSINVDVRVIATTNRSIRESIKKGEFREDLFYRLNVIPIKIPSLRERRGDIPLLVQHFIKKYNTIDGRKVKNLTDSAMNRLLRLPLKGNVRELENIIERAVLLSNGVSIQEKDLFLEETFSEYGCDACCGEEKDGLPLDFMAGPLREAERKIIFHTLDKTNGNRTLASKILGINVRTLRNKLNEYKESEKMNCSVWQPDS